MNPTYNPGPILIAAQKRLDRLRRRNERLKREIAQLMTTKRITHAAAAYCVLSAHGYRAQLAKEHKAL